MTVPRLRATISFDLDDLWTYLKTRGDRSWAGYPTYLPVIVPRALALLEELKASITFFVVGRDAARPENAGLLGALASSGHEIGNHSYEHDCWLHRYKPMQLEDDIGRAEEAIESVTGRRPKGFRGPGFSWSVTLLEVLAARGYRYDASTLPTIIGPLARLYFLRTASLTQEQRAEREALFGSFSDALRPLRPYRWSLASGPQLLEVPVTTMPMTRLPFHLSYLIYLSSYSWYAMATYLEMSLALCRAWRIEPSFLLHPLDLLGPSEAPGLEFFPGMALSTEHKAVVFRHAIRRIQAHFRLVTLESFTDELAGNAALPLRDAKRPLGSSSRSLDNLTKGSPETAAASLPFRLRPPESLTPADPEVFRET